MSWIQDFLSAKDKLNPQKILENAKNRVGKQPKNNYKELSDYLNAVFYPKKNNNNGALLEKFENNILSAINETFDRVYQRYDFDKNNGVLNESMMEVNNSGKIATGIYGQTQHKQYINSDTLKVRKQALETRINSLKNSFTDFTDLIADMENLVKDMNLMLQQSGAEQNIENMRINVNNNKFRELMDKIDLGWSKVTYVEALPLPVRVTGEAFERMLQASSAFASRKAEEIAEDEILEALKQKTAGSTGISRGMLSMETKIDGLEIKQSKNSNDVYAVIEGKNGSKFSTSTIFSKKDMKMDVEYVLPLKGSEQTATFRISAKNWAAVDGNFRDFGETSMLAGILRTTGSLDKAIMYGLQAGYIPPDHNKDISVNAQRFGDICVIVDILMGYSQKEGYADTIVVNNRKAQQIEVYSMRDILNQVQKAKSFNSFLVKSPYKHIIYSKEIKPQITELLTNLNSYNLRVGSNILRLGNKN